MIKVMGNRQQALLTLLLHTKTGLTVDELSRGLHVTRNAVRQHLASLGSDAFAVLLAWIDAPADAPRVSAKLAQQLRQPFSVAGTDRAVAVSVGLAAYPEHGREAEALLRRAVSQAASLATVGRTGFGNRVERGPATAANDD